MFHLVPIAAVLLYVIAAAFYVKLLSSKGAADSSLARRIFFGGFLCHSTFVILSIAGVYSDRPVMPNFALSLSLLSVFLVGLFLLLDRKLSLELLGAFAAPTALFLMLFSSILYHFHRPLAQIPKMNFLLWVHIGCAILANLSFISAFVVSLALVVRDSSLRKKRYQKLIRKMPSLRMLDKMNAVLLLSGVLLMTCGVGGGVLFALTNKVDIFELDPRFVWSSTVMLGYAAIVTARAFYNIRGRRGGLLSIAGFILLISSFIGVQVLSGGFHVH